MEQLLLVIVGISVAAIAIRVFVHVLGFIIGIALALLGVGFLFSLLFAG